MTVKGFVVKFDAERGYGFIRMPAGGADAFVHINDVEGRQPLTPGQRVTCELVETNRGPAARNVKPGTRPLPPTAIFLTVAAFIIAAFVVPGRMYGLPWLFLLLAGVNAATFLLYGYDKAVSGGRALRVPETVLHLLALAGGTPAAFVSQRFFRHKTIKGSFVMRFWLIAGLQVIALAGWIWCCKNQPPGLPPSLRFLFPSW